MHNGKGVLYKWNKNIKAVTGTKMIHVFDGGTVCKLQFCLYAVMPAIEKM